MLVQEVWLEAVQKVSSVTAHERQVMQVFGILKLWVERTLETKGIA